MLNKNDVVQKKSEIVIIKNEEYILIIFKTNYICQYLLNLIFL